MKNRLLAPIAMAFVALANANADVCSPQHLLKIVVENGSPDMSGHNYGSLPRTIYRYRSTFARIEEPIDAAKNTKGLIVFNEPNAWIVNLSNREGTHLVDKTAPLIVRVALFADRSHDKSFPRELLALEFGCEWEFFDRRKSPEEPVAGGSSGRVRRAFVVGEWKAVLVRQKKASTPAFAFLFHGERVATTLTYTRYETLPPDMKLFEKPSGIQFTEGQTK